MYNKKVWGWALYDFANTAFSALFVTFFYPLFVKNYLGGNEFHVGMVFGLSMVAVGLSVPIIGALSDLTGKRVGYIAGFTLACVVACALVSVSPLWMALFLGFVANYCYHSALVVYNALLPHLGGSHGKLSGFGVALGYLGTFVSLGLVSLLLNYYGWESMRGIASTFVMTALFFLVFSLPLFCWVRDKPKKLRKNWVHLVEESVQRVWKTIWSFGKHKGFLPFLGSSFLYSNGTTAAIIFLYLYADEVLGISAQEFLWVFVGFSIAAAAGSYVSGYIVDYVGGRRVLMGCGFIWLIVIWLLMLQDASVFSFAGALGGVALGAIWTANRPLILKITPHAHAGEFFGYNELADKFSGAIEPILFGWLVVTYGYGAALWSLIACFAVGMVLLLWVPKV